MIILSVPLKKNCRALTGIEDEPPEKANYWQKLTQFHASPIVKMSYEFVSSIYL
jgi:hypothetical protein